MSKNFIYVDSSGDYVESIGAYETNEFINTSFGIADKNKPIVLDEYGKLHESFIRDSDISHNDITDLESDTHPQYLKTDGTRPVEGKLVYNAEYTFQDPEEIVSKRYADAIAAGFGPKKSVRVATNSDLNATYNNGTDGVGATLEKSNSPLEQLSIDGIYPDINDRVLVKDQSNPEENGIYTVAVQGSTTNTWRMIRATDFDENPSGEIKIGVFVPVENGNTFAGYSFYQDHFIHDQHTIGTDEITFSKFANPTDLSGGHGIAISANTVSVTTNDIIGDGLKNDNNKVAIDWTTNFTIDNSENKVFQASDIATTTQSKGASIVGINDTNNYYTNNTVEDALQEISDRIGGVSSALFDFTNNHILSNNNTINEAFDKLDQQWEKLQNSSVGEGASMIAINDAGGYTTKTDVEEALQEIYVSLGDSGVQYYIVQNGTSIVAGEPLMMTNAGEVVKYSLDEKSLLGIATSSVTGDGSKKVGVVSYDYPVTVETSIISGGGFSISEQYFWNGSHYTTTPPTSSGNHIWLLGVAKDTQTIHAKTTYITRRV